MSLNDSTEDDSVGSGTGVDSGALGLDGFGSEVPGLDMRSLQLCGVIPLRITPARVDPGGVR